MKKTLILTVILLVSSIYSIGCFSNPSPEKSAELRASAEMEELWGTSVGAVNSDAKLVNDQMSESHRMMAIMILSGAGMDNNVENYDRVYLVDVATEDGNTGKVVVVEKDGKRTTVIPQALKP